MYLPTTAIFTSPSGLLTLSTTRCQRVRSGGGASLMPKTLEHLGVEALLVIGGRRVIDGRQVERRDHALGRDVAEQRDLAPLVVRDRLHRAAQQHIGGDADGAQFLDRMLGRLGLQLAGGFDIGQQRQMDETGMVAAQLVAELADGLEERQALDVADRAADLAKQEIDIVAAGQSRIP